VYETATELFRTGKADFPNQRGTATAVQDRGHSPTKRGRGARLLLAAFSLGAGIYAANLLLATGGHTPSLTVATVLAFAGGLLSTWSPCGYSSLSLLRPHGHYSIRSVAYWIPTLMTHVLGYAIGAIVLGGGLGLLAWLLPIDGLGGWPLALVGLLAVGYGLHCLGLIRMPYPQRRAQVSHGARNHYAMWKIGLIYGVQLGLNFVTYVRTPITLHRRRSGHRQWFTNSGVSSYRRAQPGTMGASSDQCDADPGPPGAGMACLE